MPFLIMCEHSKYVFNKYINKRLLVSCGSCPACLQQKANARAMRIKNHSDGRLCLFVTLTYDNRFIPYVKASDLLNINENTSFDINVYRDADLRWYRNNLIVSDKKTVLSSFPSNKFNFYCLDVPQLNKKDGCTGVIYWSDVQNFIKRLRINLKRLYGYENQISYYAVGEYGSHTYRPHFHLLVYFTEGSFEEISTCIVKAWPYGDMSRENKRIQIAIDASGYVASYVNKSSGLPKILETNVIKQKHSHSLYFGHNLQSFSLPSILEKADRGDMSYTRQVLKDGVPLLVSLPIPKYVVNRFFPKFKGYSSFTPDEVLQLLRFPWQLWNRLGESSGHLISDILQYTKDEFNKFVKRINKCIFKYIEITGKTIYDYAIDYLRVWRVRSSYVLKHSYDDIQSLLDYSWFYENANEYCYNPSLSLSLPSPDSFYYECNPNKRQDIRLKSFNLGALYQRKDNLKMINNTVLSSIDEEF